MEKELNDLRNDLKRELIKIEKDIETNLSKIKNDDIKKLLKSIVKRQNLLFEFYISSREDIIKKAYSNHEGKNEKNVKNKNEVGEMNAFTESLNLISKLF